MRSPAFRSFLSISLALPALALVSFVATVPLAVDDRQGADVDVATRTPVILIVMDEFAVSSLWGGDGSIDAVRYPNFARLAQKATWYPRATTVADYTTDAVPAILTGRNPKAGELPTLADHPDNLFTLLGERFGIHAQEQVTRLCPARYCPRTGPRGVARGSSTRTDVRRRGRISASGSARVADGQPAADRRAVGCLRRRGRRTRGRTILGALDFGAWLRVAERAQDRKRAEYGRFLRSLRPAEGRPPCISSTSCFRTPRGSSSRRAANTTAS